MDNATIFYVVGPVLAASAVTFSILGLRFKKLPGRAAPIIALWFLILIGVTTTFAVLHSKDAEQERSAAAAPTSNP